MVLNNVQRNVFAELQDGTASWTLLFIYLLSVTAHPLQGGEGAGANPSQHWVRARLTLDKSPVHHRADTQRQTTIHAHIHTYGQFRVAN